MSRKINCAPDNIFKKPNYRCKLDYTWGFINTYSLFSNEHLERIKQLNSVFQDKKQFLDMLSRRIKFLQTSIWELRYLLDRYLWNQLSGIFDIYISRFEQCICLQTEIIQQTFEFYTKNKKTYSGVEVNNFSDIGKFLLDKNNGLPTYHLISINDTVLLSILLFIRNSIVHGHREIEYVQNGQNPIISGNISIKDRLGVLKQLYLSERYKQFLPLYKNKGGKMYPERFLSTPMIDSKFFLKINFKLTKGCDLDNDGTIVSFTTDTYRFIKQLTDGEFHILLREIFNVLLNEN
ncbi:MAG TPA: hypothetical protein VMY59_01240 [Candidatus Thermoplasmatota archaeon]|nr:hypothetical protein [Candidatus Thermoplasmatota archaeon]HUU88891.1 hypothetical protein [Candidatus Glassbacteria bacterium]